MTMIKLQSSDGEVFPTDNEIVKYLGTIKAMIEDAGMDGDEDAIVPLPTVKADTLRLVLQWAYHEHHKIDSVSSGNNDNNAKDDRSAETSSWETDFLQIDHGTLFELISAANYLDARGLLHITCKAVATMVKDKSPKEIRLIFNIIDDLASDQIECEQTAAVLKVSVDDWEAIFDYFSLHDLYSMAETCKRMRIIGGWYFKTNFPNIEVSLCGQNAIVSGRQMNGFYAFISNLSKHFSTAEDFDFITKNFDSLRTISLLQTSIYPHGIESLKHLLNRIECIELIHCRSTGDVYENLLKYCTNLQTLKITASQINGRIYGIGYNWLLKEFPTLEHIELKIEASEPIVQLIRFLKQHPNLKSLTFNEKLFDTHWQLFMESECKFETMTLDGKFALDELSTQLIALHGGGFYRRLNLQLNANVRDSTKLSLIPGLEELHLFGSNNNITTPINVKTMEACLDSINNFKAAAENIINVNRFIMYKKTTADSLLLTLRNFPTLKKIECQWFDGSFLDLPYLNEERAKVAGARKVIISIDEDAYLATKLRFGDKEFSLIEVKRIVEVDS